MLDPKIYTTFIHQALNFVIVHGQMPTIIPACEMDSISHKARKENEKETEIILSEISQTKTGTACFSHMWIFFKRHGNQRDLIWNKERNCESGTSVGNEGGDRQRKCLVYMYENP